MQKSYGTVDYIWFLRRSAYLLHEELIIPASVCGCAYSIVNNGKNGGLIMKFGVMSDLHLFNKTINLERAVSKLQDSDIVLIVGDIADRARENQYDIVAKLIGEHFASVPVYCVSGNHDNPARDDTVYRKFETTINAEYKTLVDESGGFYKYINDNIDLIGLNPVYHQKLFFFSNKGEQIAFLQKKLNVSRAKYHIVMCHPPLIAHNPQRTADMTPYIASEQNNRLQKIIDENKRIIFISGHTHVSPDIEFDAVHNNLYINDGSICPTSTKNSVNKTQQGNVIMLEIKEGGVLVTVKGIHNEKIFTDTFIRID